MQIITKTFFGKFSSNLDKSYADPLEQFSNTVFYGS